MENTAARKRCLVSGNADTVYEVVLTDTAKGQAQRVLDYIFFGSISMAVT